MPSTGGFRAARPSLLRRAKSRRSIAVMYSAVRSKPTSALKLIRSGCCSRSLLPSALPQHLDARPAMQVDLGDLK